MCGIVGIVNLREGPAPDAELLRAMGDTMVHSPLSENLSSTIFANGRFPIQRPI